MEPFSPAQRVSVPPRPRPGDRSRRFAVVRRRLKPLRIELNPILAGFLGLAGLALLGWSGATTSYALFRDEFLIQLVSRHTTTERNSRSEIARLTADVERINSQLLVERENFASQLGELAHRQANLEKRQSVLSRLDVAAEKSSDFEGGLRLGDPAEPLRETRVPPLRGEAADLLARYEAIEAGQREQIVTAQSRLESKRNALIDIYATLGLTPAIASPVKAGLGGLYLPFGLSNAPAASDTDRLMETAREADQLRQGLDRVPVGKPLPEVRAVSGFGNRTDPFVGGLAFHSGVDLEAVPGAPAFATASGTVASAEWTGGYGLMVEIAHDHGYSTRYAHLSRIAVKQGQTVGVGDVVGYVGSTGRSTGPHLHYETRRNDNALNPTRFLKAAAAIAD
jgi:murein DD-endopeptidase MepM/ murein hydrolase activator NlpD